MLALVGVGLWQSRQDAWLEATLASENLVTALGRDIGGSIALVDRGVVATIDSLRVPGIWSYPKKIRQLILFAPGRWSPYLDHVFVLDGAGRLIADSGERSAIGTSFADHDYFKGHRASKALDLSLTEIRDSRHGRGQLSLVLSRRVNAQDGSFAGVVVAIIPLHPIDATISGIVLGPKSAVNLLTLGGTILARSPPLRTRLVNIGGSPTFERMKREGSGYFVGLAKVDHVERLYVFGRPQGLPLILDVARSTEEIMAPWWKRAILFGVSVVGLCAAILALAHLFQRELIRRTRIEAELADLAATDGLTGLLNRRSFDDALRREWRRTRRTDGALALMMIDVDNFKAFNDLYGHVAGDKGLQTIAQLMKQNARRTNDQAARVGGEEFAILMPDTGAHAAQERAEALRLAVAGMAIRHGGSAGGVLTISVGVITSAGVDNPEDLLKQADAALYQAKSGGRNMVFPLQVPALLPEV